MSRTSLTGAREPASFDALLHEAWASGPTLWAGLPDPVVVSATDGRIVERHVPVALGDAFTPGTQLTDAVRMPEREDVEKALRSVIDEGRAKQIDIPFEIAGKTTWYASTLAPILSQGVTIGALWCLTDVTARRKEEARLRRSEALMVDTQGVAHLGTWDWDPSEPAATWSDQLFRIYGLASDAHVPTYEDYLQRVHPDDRQRVKDATDGVFQDHRPYSHDERIFRPDGSIRWLHTWAQAVKDDEGKLLRLVGVCQDITERKLAEIEVEERLREKEVLLKEVHHRVKNNLQVVTSMLSMQMKAGGDERLREGLAQAAARVRSMAMVHETLYQSGVLSRLDFGNYLRMLTRDVQRAHASDQATVKLTTKCEGVTLDLDQSIQCGLILNELASNAYKHAFPDGRTGTIALEVTSSPDGMVRIVVADDGVSMKQEAIEGKVTTLGLRLVRALTRQLGGELKIDASKGTCVEVTFKANGAQVA